MGIYSLNGHEPHRYLGGVYGIGAAKKKSTYDQRQEWLAQLKDMEKKKESGRIDPEALHNEAKRFADMIHEYQGWPFDRNAWHPNIPETAVYLQRAGAIQIVSAAKLNPEQAQRVASKSEGSALLVKEAQTNPNLVINANAMAETANPALAALLTSTGTLIDAGSQSIEDIMSGDPFRSGREQGWWESDTAKYIKYASIAVIAGVGLYLARPLFGIVENITDRRS
jgi:acyl-coenzyme A synthetase/AMP-(fatty) acid ligase